jgi:hypothetical protein
MKNGFFSLCLMGMALVSLGAQAESRKAPTKAAPAASEACNMFQGKYLLEQTIAMSAPLAEIKRYMYLQVGGLKDFPELKISGNTANSTHMTATMEVAIVPGGDKEIGAYSTKEEAAKDAKVIMAALLASPQYKNLKLVGKAVASGVTCAAEAPVVLLWGAPSTKSQTVSCRVDFYCKAP